MIEMGETESSVPERPAWPPQHLAGFDAFLREMNKELKTATGRGLVMVACSYIDATVHFPHFRRSREVESGSV